MKFPPDWQVVRLKDIALDMQPGFAQRPGENGSIGQIRTHNVTPDGRISLKGLKKVNPSENESNKYSLQPGDIIFNNTNSEEWVGKTALYEELSPLTFSNHMTRIRVNNDLIIPAFLSRYLHFLWKIGFSRTRAKRWVSQAGIDQQELSKFEVPLPSLIEQKRIVDILKQADELRRLRCSILERTRQLSAALFLEMFGDPISNPNGYKKKELEHLGQLDRGISKNRPRDAAFLYGGPYPFIQTGDVTNSGGWVTNYTQTYSKAGLAQSRLWPKGTLCITIAANIAKTGILTFDACFPDSIVGFLPNDSVTTEYIMAAIDLYQKLLETQAPQGAQKNINLQVLRNLQVPAPPKQLQDKFSLKFKELFQYITRQQHSIAYLKEVNESINNEAFCGDLTAVWRKYAQQASEFGASERKKLVKRPKNKVTITVEAPEERKIAKLHHRHSLSDQLSEIQNGVLQAIRHEWRGTLIPSEDLDEFIERSFQIEHLEDANDQIKHALNQLAGLGLIAKISLPNQAGKYVTGYRSLREEELTKESDQNRLSTYATERQAFVRS